MTIDRFFADDGSDPNPGTQISPKQTGTEFNAMSKATDDKVFLRHGDTWSNSPNITVEWHLDWSGTDVNNRATLDSYDPTQGAKPLIDNRGTNLKCMELVDSSFFRIANIREQNTRSGGNAAGGIGIAGGGYSEDGVIDAVDFLEGQIVMDMQRGQRILVSANTGKEWDNNGFGSTGHTTLPANNITFEDTTADGTNSAGNECFNNHRGDVDKDTGPFQKYLRCTATAGPENNWDISSGDDVTIESCESISSGLGIGLGGQRQFLRRNIIFNKGSGRALDHNGRNQGEHHIHSNIFHSNNQTDIRATATAGGGDIGQIDHWDNTHYADGFQAGPVIQFKWVPGVADILGPFEMQRCLFVRAAGTATLMNFETGMSITPTGSEGNTVKGNLYSGFDSTAFHGGRTFAQWQADFGYDTPPNGSLSDPLLVNPPTDFHLAAGSPAIGLGLDILDPDFDGKDKEGDLYVTFDAGAYAFLGSSQFTINGQIDARAVVSSFPSFGFGDNIMGLVVSTATVMAFFEFSQLSTPTISGIVHLDAMKNRLPHHARTGPNLEALLSVAAGQYQSIEEALQDMLVSRSLDVAVGAQLDGIGDMMDLARAGSQSDANYRFALQTRVITLARSGDAEAIIEAFINATEAPAADYTEVYPATFQISGIPTVDTDNPDVSAFITDTMDLTKPAGVRMTLIVEEGFTLSQFSEVDGAGNGPIVIDEGFGSSLGGETDGGQLSRVL